MTVRPATLADLDAWVHFRRAVYDGDPDAEREIPLLLEDPDQHAFIAEDRGRRVGLLEIRLRNFAEGCSTSPVGYLEGIWVEPEARRRGVAAALIAAGEAWARDRGCCEMASDAALENLASHSFHTALGFVEVDRVVCFRKPIVDRP